MNKYNHHTPFQERVDERDSHLIHTNVLTTTTTTRKLRSVTWAFETNKHTTKSGCFNWLWVVKSTVCSIIILCIRRTTWFRKDLFNHSARIVTHIFYYFPLLHWGRFRNSFLKSKGNSKKKRQSTSEENRTSWVSDRLLFLSSSHRRYKYNNCMLSQTVYQHDFTYFLLLIIYLSSEDFSKGKRGSFHHLL